MNANSIPNPEPPTSSPTPDIQYVIRMLIFHFRDKGATERGKPEGVRGMELAWDFRRWSWKEFRRKTPQDVGDLRNRKSADKSPLEITFDEEKRGKQLYFCLRWEGDTGLKGPWSAISSAYIP
jgi:hypothetical protein